MIQHWIITGDTHRVFTRFDHLDKTPNTGIIILGDAGLNYTLDINDRNTKEALCRKYPYDFFFAQISSAITNLGNLSSDSAIKN